MIIKPSFLEILIYSKNGILDYHKKLPIKSLVRQFIDFAQINCTSVAGNVRDTSNTLRSQSPSNHYKCDAPATNANYGIRVGTGTNPVSISDYNLQTPIAHGNGAGQLYHQGVVISSVTIAGNEAYLTIQRNFNNNSGASITVQEAGLISFTGLYYFLLLRDLTGSIEILNTKTLVAQYTWKVTV